MQYLMRKWDCRNCGRSNARDVALDGSAKCEYCVDVMQIQPSRPTGTVTTWVRRGLITLRKDFQTRKAWTWEPSSSLFWSFFFSVAGAIGIAADAPD
jgi:hypothetical protein